MMKTKLTIAQKLVAAAGLSILLLSLVYPSWTICDGEREISSIRAGVISTQEDVLSRGMNKLEESVSTVPETVSARIDFKNMAMEFFFIVLATRLLMVFFYQRQPRE